MARAVVFDLGGVVVRICRSWEEACARAGVEWKTGVMDPARMAERKGIHREYERGGMGCGEFFERIAGTTGGLYSAEEFARVHEAWLIGEYAGVGELVGELHDAGVVTGVLSNTNASHWRVLTGTGGLGGVGGGGRAGGEENAAQFPTARRVRHLHASHLLGHAKPDAAIYRAFEERSGVRGGEILFFDDLEENVVGARGCGWGGHRVDPLGDPGVEMRGVLRRLGILR